MATTQTGEKSEITDYHDHAHQKDAMAFLDRVGDAELLKFLRRLPMVAANADDSPISLSDLIYEMKLWPFVKEAYKEVEGSPGISNRILILSRTYKLAASRLERETGEKRSRERVIDLPTFISIYSTEGLP